MGLKGLLAGAAAITIVTVASACTPPPAPGPSPLGENVRFSGLVNGTASNAVIYTACGGPVVGDRVGSVVGGQTVAVRRDAGGDGLTDRAGGVFARTDSSGFVVHITASDTPTKAPAEAICPSARAALAARGSDAPRVRSMRVSTAASP